MRPACKHVLKSTRNVVEQQIRGMSALTMDNLNTGVRKLEYAVRGPLVTRALEIEQELLRGHQKPFKKVIKANIGDAHAMGQKPISFIRQVLSLVTNPQLTDIVDYPEDVKQRAREILNGCAGGSIGSYTTAYGIEVIRKQVAQYIEKRDGYPANWEDVSICAGASSGIKNLLQLFCNQPSGKPTGVMIPIPQYPLYSATLPEFELLEVPYFLNEDDNWGLDIGELKSSLDAARKQCEVRALVVINPGNPTGQVLTRENIEKILKFAYEENLLVLADEVYQDNVYDPNSKFYSFKKVLRDLGDPISSNLELVSCMSVSKGYVGECGIRGGWMEIVNVDQRVQAELYKATSAKLCPTTLGQATVSCVAAPPEPGSPSFQLFDEERSAVLASLAQRAKMIADAFNAMPGFKCNTVQGAMYAFPSFQLSQKALDAAKKVNQPGDVFYTFQLLEETGICVVPGSGFRQRPGTFHFRTTILPPVPLLQEMLRTFKEFHLKFTAKYE